MLVKVALSTNTCPKNTLAQCFTQSLSKALWHKLYTRQTPLYFITSVNLYVVHIFSCTLQNHPSYVYHQFSLSIVLTQYCSIVCDENVVPIFRYLSSQILSFNILFSCGFSKPNRADEARLHGVRKANSSWQYMAQAYTALTINLTHKQGITILIIKNHVYRKWI